MLHTRMTTLTDILELFPLVVKSCAGHISKTLSDIFMFFFYQYVEDIEWACHVGVVGWCEGVLYLMSPGRPTDIGLQLGKACCPCSR